METAKQTADQSAAVRGDQRPHDRWVILERHEAVANGRLVGGLMKSFGVFVAAPAGSADAARRDEGRGIDDPLVGGGTGHASSAAEDRGAVDLEIGASDGGENGKALIEDRDRGLSFSQSGPKDGGKPGKFIGLLSEGVVHGGAPGELAAAVRNTAHYICPAFTGALATGTSKRLSELG